MFRTWIKTSFRFISVVPEELSEPFLTEGSGFAPGEADAGNRLGNISRGISSLTLQNILTSLLGFVFFGTLLRFVSPTEYSAYSSVLTGMGIASSLSAFGLQYASARYVAFFSETETQAKIVRTVLNLSLAFSGLVAFVFFAVSTYLSEYFMKTSSWTWLFWLGSLWLFSSSLATVFQGFVQGLKKYSLLAKMLLISRVAMVVFSVVALFLFRNVGDAIVAWILYYVVVIFWSLRTVSKSGLLQLGREVNPADPKGYYSEVMRYCLPLGIAGLLAAISSSTDSIVVGGFLNSVSNNSLGIYTVALTISGVLSLVLLTPISTALLPEASSSRSHSDLSNGLRMAIRFSVLAVLPSSLIVASLSNQLILLFSSNAEYLSGSIALELIAGLFLPLALETVIIYLLQAVGKTLHVLVLGVVTAGCDIGFSLVLVPRFGLLGAAMSRVGVGITGAIVAFLLAKEYLSRDRLSFYVKGLVASLVPFFAIVFLSMNYSNRLITLFPYALLGVIIYILMIRAMKVLNEEDRSVLSHALPSGLRKLIRIL